jgi:nucleoside-diphosphate-sugar epimerase
MRVLLTGASGYLGQHVLARLRARGCEIVVLGRHRPAGAEDLSWLPVDLLDGRDLGPVLREARVSHLLHLAWYAEYGKFWTSALNLRWVDASLRLLQAFTEQGGRHVLMAGSCAEYDWSGAGPLHEDRTPLNPASLYGTAKDATRRLAQAWCRDQGATLAWGHVFFPFGPGEARQRMLPSLIEVFDGRAAPFGVNAEARRGMLPVRDAAEALVHLLAQGCEGRYNICSGQPVQVGEVVRTLARLCGADPAPVLALATARPGDPAVLVGDNNRLLATGWRPVQTLEQGLQAMVQATLMKPVAPEGVQR